NELASTMHAISNSSVIRHCGTQAVAELHEEVNPSKTTHLRRLCAVDIGNVRDAVLALPADAWDRPETFGVNYNKRGALRQTAHVIFRFSDRRTAPIRYLVLPIWHEWRARLLPLLRAAVLPLGYRTGV